MIRIIFAITALSFAFNLYWVAADPHWLILPAALVAWYIADLTSGVVHMVMDYRPCTPGLGLKDLFFYEGSRGTEEYRKLFRQVMARVGPIERIVFDFKNHHPRPNALGRRNLTFQIRSTVIFGSLPFSVLLNLACLAGHLSGWTIPGWFVAGAVVFFLGGTFSQYFHGTLHRDRNPWLVRAMRRLHLLITPAAHDIHHATLDRDFATINGWSNPALNIVFDALRRRGHFPSSGLEPG